MISEDKIRRDMMELWKETFHDSSRYIQLVFDTYFTPDNVFVRYHENRLIASLFSIPYEFQNLTKGGERQIQRGLYLCGLATRPECRRQGIMTELMREVEVKAKADGYDFTFLIPADSHLREYYRRFGYEDSSFRTIERLEEEACLSHNRMHIYSIKDVFENGNFRLLENLADWCIEREKETESPTIVHSRKDMMAVMAENENSIFLTDEAVDLKKSILVKVTGVAFPEFHKEAYGAEKVVLAGLFVKTGRTNDTIDRVREINIQTRVGNEIYRHYSGQEVELRMPFVQMQSCARGVEPYAMLKSLDENENSEKIENTTYKIFLMLD